MADGLGSFAVVTGRTNRGGIEVPAGKWGERANESVSAAVAVPLGGLYAFDT